MWAVRRQRAVGSTLPGAAYGADEGAAVDQQRAAGARVREPVRPLLHGLLGEGVTVSARRNGQWEA